MGSTTQQLSTHFPCHATREQKGNWCFSRPKDFRNFPAHEILEDTKTLNIPKNTQKTIVEILEGKKNSTLIQNIKVNIKENASLTYITVHVGKSHNMMYRNINTTVAQSGTYHHIALHAGPSLCRTQNHITTAGENAQINLLSLSLLSSNNKADTIHKILFKHPNCNANVTQENILSAKSHAVFQGKFHIEKQAQKTDAYMLCKNLMLAPSARASQKPELEIYADDVKCSHGTSTGNIDDKQLFYLQTRGIPLAEAKKLLVQARIEAFLQNLNEKYANILRPHTTSWLKSEKILTHEI